MNGHAPVKRPASKTTTLSIRDSATSNPSARRETERFESLVGELSAAMAQAAADGVDREIETWLGKICVALGLDRSAIYERDSPGLSVRTSHIWLRPNFPAFPRNYDPERFFKTTTDWVMAGNNFIFSHPSEIPVEVGDLRRFVERYGPKASAAFPMRAGNEVIGAATFGRFRSPRQWNPKLLEHLALVVRLFGAAIERKQAEVAMRAARDELALAQRRSMMGELVASLTHEVNQPLAAILGNLGGLSRLIAQGNPDPALAARAISNATEDAKRAGEIVRRFRAMFRGDGSRKASIDIGALVSEVVRLIESEAALRKVRIQIRKPPSAIPVFGDRILIQQCILNLLMNAFDAVAKVESEQPKVTIEIAPEKQGWVPVSVHDLGPGIHPSIAGRLFEPFVTTKPNGMGLGLLVTRSIVEDHGGKIMARPNPAGGSIFTFTLPAAKKNALTSARRVSKKDLA
jgi:signal transduction histidine kinase